MVHKREIWEQAGPWLHMEQQGEWKIGFFSHWVLYRQMGHLWMEETSMDLFSAFKDTLIAYFILSFFPSDI